MGDIFMGIGEILCGFWSVYMIYKRYVYGNGFDKYDHEFFRRNSMMSTEDKLMLLYGFVGVYTFISSIMTSGAFSRMCGLISGGEFLGSVLILYFVTRVR